MNLEMIAEYVPTTGKYKVAELKLVATEPQGVTMRSMNGAHPPRIAGETMRSIAVEQVLITGLRQLDFFSQKEQAPEVTRGFATKHEDYLVRTYLKGLAVSNRPTKFIMDELGMSIGTVAHWVGGLRSRGHLDLTSENRISAPDRVLIKEVNGVVTATEISKEN